MSRWGNRWTPEMAEAHQRLYSRNGTAIPVIDEGSRTTQAHAAWKQRSTAEGSGREAGAGRGLQPDDHPLPPIYPLVGLCRAAGLPEPVPEFTFHPHRKWRFDYAFPDHKVAVEIEGGVWTQGRHTRGKGFLADVEKYNAAVLLGWRVIRFVPDELHHAIPALQTLLQGNAA